MKNRLDGTDTIVVDLGGIYQQLFNSRRLAAVDYAQEPVQFDRYQPDDREKIRAFCIARTMNAMMH